MTAFAVFDQIAGQVVTQSYSEVSPMIRTIHIAGTVTAQGAYLKHLADGRIAIDAGGHVLIGWPIDPVRPARTGGPASAALPLVGLRLSIAAAVMLLGTLAAAPAAHALHHLTTPASAASITAGPAQVR